MTLKYEFKGVNDELDEHEDLHNKLKYHQMISDEQITSDNVKISKLKGARVAQLTEKNDVLKKNISASKPKLHESRGEKEENADREKLQAER